MRLTMVILLGTLLQVSAGTFAQKVTLSEKNASLEALFSEIGKQTGYGFIYTNEVLKNTHPVDIDVREVSLEEALASISKDQPIEFEIQKTTIIVKLKEKSILDKVTKFFTPPINIVGRVIDSVGNPLVGASVQVKGADLSTSTDHRGAFALNGVEEGSILIVSFLGYETQEVKAESRLLRRIVLKAATSDLDEIQVVGYGTTTKRFNTGNVVTISGEDIAKQPVMNPLQALQGMVPGLQVQMLSGSAGAPIRVQIRGQNSLNPEASIEPLYIIDGIPQTTLDAYSTANGVSKGVVQDAGIGQSVLFNINPDDIESISVLKDGDATAIYGSRAANGVILITTKNGSAGPTKLNISLEQGIQAVPSYPEMLSLQQYLAMRREAFKNDAVTPTVDNAPDLVVWDTTRYTDWARELVSAGHHTNINASVSGGDSRTTFRLSGSYADQVQLNSIAGGATRATAALNTRHSSANRKLTITASGSYAYSHIDSRGAPIASRTAPNAPPIYDAQGNLNFYEWEELADVSYPFSSLKYFDERTTQKLSSIMRIDYSLLKGLTIGASARFDLTNNANDRFTPIAAQNPMENPTGTVRFGGTKINNLGFDTELRYHTRIGKGQLQAFISTSIQSASTGISSLNGTGYTNDDLLRSINHAGVVTSTDRYAEYKYAALFGRINYNWDAKYVLNFNIRRDGSSRFAPGKQFGNFGSVGAAWIASEEPWLKAALPKWFSFVKLRGSYALTGSDAVGDYEYLPRYSTSKRKNAITSIYPYGGIQPYVALIASNQQYQWESLKSLEGALTLGFLEDRINVELAWYQKRSSDQLTDIPTPIYTGFSRVTTNWAATVQNRGLELLLSADLINRPDFQWNTSFNIGRNTNMLYAYPGLEESPYDTKYKIGTSLRTEYFLNLLGVNPLTGKYVYEDYNKDGGINTSSGSFPGTGKDDRYMAYDMNPKFSGGWSNNVRWKQFGLSFQFSFINQLGRHPFHGIALGSMNNFIVPKEMLEDHWRKPGDYAKYPRYSLARASDAFPPVDASFVRLNNIALSYNVSRTLVQKIGMKSANFSLRAQNLWMITAYDADPEVQGGAFNPVPLVMVGNLSFTF